MALKTLHCNCLEAISDPVSFLAILEAIVGRAGSTDEVTQVNPEVVWMGVRAAPAGAVNCPGQGPTRGPRVSQRMVCRRAPAPIARTGPAMSNDHGVPGQKNVVYYGTDWSFSIRGSQVPQRMVPWPTHAGGTNWPDARSRRRTAP
jgi:hypothetical protein